MHIHGLALYTWACIYDYDDCIQLNILCVYANCLTAYKSMQHWKKHFKLDWLSEYIKFLTWVCKYKTTENVHTDYKKTWVSIFKSISYHGNVTSSCLTKIGKKSIVSNKGCI